ncbi:MAG: (deoxy)nucleoside triphosphate pyrophosphohydrolase [Prevotellaceae bacterium]|nr:(deoxy)nucleoside triphosphate pyrophosphohydrolase [Prevotellaceae bacterium]
MNESRKNIEVVAAIIIQDGRLFATQRGYGEWKDWWEFPGGKIEPGESPKDALKREIREELATEIEVGNLLTTVEYDYPKFHLMMHCYLCDIIRGQLSLLEHEDARWLTKDELDGVKWLPADVEVIKALRL